MRLTSLLFPLLVLLVAACGDEEPRVRLATTTSTQDSGLLDAILPEFQAASGIHVDVVAVGTGAAFRLARDGNADLLLVHDRAGEEQFVAEGAGAERRDVMWNSFEILGPADDPAGVAGAATAGDALRRIAAAGATFVSRGDDSGTHRREEVLWESAGGRPHWDAYRESGQGMGATLRIADELNAYVLTDRGTRLRYGAELGVAALLGDTQELRNPYGIVLMNSERYPAVRVDEAARLAAWLTSPETAQRIADYRVNGEQLFHPYVLER